MLATVLRAERGRTGASANELAERVRCAMSRPLVLKALRETGRDTGSRVCLAGLVGERGWRVCEDVGWQCGGDLFEVGVGGGDVA
jgi:hypothetical protein